jgi:hypothetical protein
MCQSLLLRGLRIDSTFDSWQFFSNPTHPLNGTFTFSSLHIPYGIHYVWQFRWSYQNRAARSDQRSAMSSLGTVGFLTIQILNISPKLAAFKATIELVCHVDAPGPSSSSEFSFSQSESQISAP